MYPNHLNGKNYCLLFPSFPPPCFALTIREMLATGSFWLGSAVVSTSQLSAHLTVDEW